MRIAGFAIAVAAILCALLGVAVQAQTEDLTVAVRSHYPYKVQLAFFSDDRNHTWPDAHTAWNLDDTEIHEFHLSCRRGERVCYGAWVTGTAHRIWGVGEGHESCSDCCFTCDGGHSGVIELVP